MIAWRLGILLFACALPCATFAACARDLAGLRLLMEDAAFPLQWVETGMDDGRPLAMAVEEREGLLHLRFVKAHEGLWAEGAVSVCAADRVLHMRFHDDRIAFGTAAPWLVRYSLAQGVEFTVRRVGASALRVAIPGWSGTFTAGASVH